ncbi:10 TM acyl transferase domain found in Cas1p-domain-containing protein [Rhexocercosporidium sp. MPI-PUGE-AT-0058]|nr:10 TM acyl transferase domain found in Cas1p-domain-containing protein [Rhexocercosporidium sp. MPI-PUGE-AT-0058]
MVRSKFKSLSIRDRVSAVVERAFQFLLGVIIVSVIYRYCWIDVSDPFKCSALQNKGEWLDPSTKWNTRDAFKSWQPPGCMVHEYTKRDIQECFRKRRLVFIGDSTTRQIFWAVAKKMDQQKAQKEIEEMLDLDEKHTDLAFESDGIKVQFIWDPWLNSTALAEELKLFKAYSPAKSDGVESAGLLLLGTPGLWYARHGQENYFKEFRDSIDAIIPYMDHLSENDTSLPVPMTLASRRESPNLLLMAPIQVPRYEALSPSRVETMTPEKIDQMNDFLQQVSAHSRADVVWSYSLMTWDGDSSYEESGLHVVENVASAKAEILLNLRCNADAASKGYPFDRTCCSNYTQPGGAQWMMILGGMLVLPAILFSRRRHVGQIGRFLPQSELTALTVFGLVVCYCFYTDRTQIFDKVHKKFERNQFLSACGAAAVVGAFSIRRSKSPTASAKAPHDIEFLPREQTDEWKGWMQIIVLIYHYTHGSSNLGVYQIIRLLIAAYLFMTGYGHTMFFLKSEDYSFKRCSTVLIRLNLLSCVLPYMMRTNYLFYYFAPLVSFWFLIIYFTLKIGHSKNSNLMFLFGKILISAAITTALTKIPGVLEFVGTVLHYTCAISWDFSEWRFRSSLDLYIVYIGMILAALSLRSFRLESGSIGPKSAIDLLVQLTIKFRLLFQAALIALALGLPPGMWGLLRKSHTKEDYNWWQPFISFIPVLCYVVLRNSLRVFRNYHSTVFAWLGRCSLETYILQYHIWLAADTKGLLRLGLWDSSIETVLLTAVFLWVSWHTSEATHTLTRWIVGDTATHATLARKIDDDGDVTGEKSSPYLLPKVKAEEGTSWSLSNGDRGTARNGRSGGVLGMLSDSLKLRVGLIIFIMWLGNVTYR